MREPLTVIVGAGPIGLYAASLLSKENLPYLIFECEAFAGGQIARLYPEKIVVDVPEFGELPAKGIIEKLLLSIDRKSLHLGEEVLSLEAKNDKITVKTSLDSYEASRVLIATGLGHSVPRPLGVPGEKECPEVLYELRSKALLPGKRIAIFGGGDSALDWARDLSKEGYKVSLIHRRLEFRGNPKTIEGCPIDLYLPYVPKEVRNENGLLKEVIIENVQTKELVSLAVDGILVNYGQIPQVSTFGFPLSEEGFGIAIKRPDFEIASGIYAAGDVAFSKEHKKRMEPGFSEVRSILSSDSWKARGA